MSFANPIVLRRQNVKLSDRYANKELKPPVPLIAVFVCIRHEPQAGANDRSLLPVAYSSNPAVSKSLVPQTDA
jgi:hypothetical protein